MFLALFLLGFELIFLYILFFNSFCNLNELFTSGKIDAKYELTKFVKYFKLRPVKVDAAVRRRLKDCDHGHVVK